MITSCARQHQLDWQRVSEIDKVLWGKLTSKALQTHFRQGLSLDNFFFFILVAIKPVPVQ
jgi:hypothetical protein